MSERRSKPLAWSLFGFAVVLLGGGLVLSALGGLGNEDWGTSAGGFLLAAPVLAFASGGALIASRHPRNAIGWISLAIGISFVLTFATLAYASYTLEAEPGALPGGALMASLGNWTYTPGIGLLGIFVPLLFPFGRLPSPRWRVAGWSGGAGIVLASVPGALVPTPDTFPGVDNPIGVDASAALLDGVEGLGYLLLLAGFVASAASMVHRFRRARGAEREQLKWFAFSVAGLAFLFVPVTMFSFVLTEQSLAARLAQDLVNAVFAAPALGIGIAILRYRLYDIDVVINRTLVYGALTATLAAVYLGSVLVLQLALSGVTEGSSLAVAASTLGVAALFRPARLRIQELVDRRFYRRKYDAARTLERFGAHVRDEVELDSLSAELRGVVAETMQPVHVSLWLRGEAR